MKNKWYWTFKNVLLGPLLRVYNRPEISNPERIPQEGAAVMASNHQAVMDSFFLPLMCPRQIVFPAKSEYFTSPGIKGKFKKWFFNAVGQVPLDREAGDAMESVLSTGKTVLGKQDLFGIYPEGTRSPDGRIYRGKTGMARLALDTAVMVIPIAMIGTRDVNPIGSVFPRPKKVKIKVGEPIDPLAFVAERNLDPASYQAARELTNHVMHTLAELTEQPYIDAYAQDVKQCLDEGKGYPPGTEPTEE